MIDFTNIEYLKNGHPKQRKIYRLLSNLHIFDDLKPYKPVLAGTFPLGIDISTSDLDILCHVNDFINFERLLRQLYSKYEGFSIKHKSISDAPALICRFQFQQMPIEIFAQPIPVKQQQAYLHMLIEYEILQKNDRNFLKQIIQLKQEGYKTEPAFAKLLGLSGDPYKSLLKLK